LHAEVDLSVGFLWWFFGNNPAFYRILSNEWLLSWQYRQALNKSTPLHLQQKQRSFLTFGFGASGPAGGAGIPGSERISAAGSSSAVGGVPPRRESHINVNVTPTSHDAVSDTPEIRKYKKRFNSEVLCASLWGKLIYCFIVFFPSVQFVLLP
jgi:hypothetical protein